MVIGSYRRIWQYVCRECFKRIEWWVARPILCLTKQGKIPKQINRTQTTENSTSEYFLLQTIGGQNFTTDEVIQLVQHDRLVGEGALAGWRFIEIIGGLEVDRDHWQAEADRDHWQARGRQRSQLRWLEMRLRLVIIYWLLALPRSIAVCVCCHWYRLNNHRPQAGGCCCR